MKKFRKELSFNKTFDRDIFENYEIRFYLKINLSTTISMKRSRQELSIDMVIH